MAVDAKTIQLFLPHGEPRGVRIAEFTTRIVQAIAFPRSKLDRALQRDELSGVGVYFLIGQREEEGEERPSVYVGEAEDCAVRLRQHNADETKDYWQSAVVIISRTNSFTKAHVRLLEYTSIQRVRDAGRYMLENGNAGIQPYIPEAMRAEVEEVFETMDVLLSTLGYPVFDPVGSLAVLPRSTPAEQFSPPLSPPVVANPPPTVDAPHVFWYRGSGFSARLIYNEDGFVVLKGSTARPEVFASGGVDVSDKRERLVREGVLSRQPNGLVFERDHAFRSASAAGVLIAGASVNGWIVWTDDRGRTLNDVYRRRL